MMAKDKISRNFKNPRDSYSRIEDIREPKSKILIFCQGEKTELNYFEQFRYESMPKLDVEAINRDPMGLVKKGISKSEEKEGYDQIWFVFDRDEFTTQNFNESFRIIDKENKKRIEENKPSIQIAYSNECFELWFLLHFSYCESAISRQQYMEKLNKLFQQKLNYSKGYEKNNKDNYSMLEQYQEAAIKNAENLMKKWTGNNRPLNPGKDNPSTKVHELVKELRKLKRQ